jgi:hypothetical protein
VLKKKKKKKKPSPSWRGRQPEAGYKKNLKKNTHKVNIIVAVVSYQGFL